MSWLILVVAGLLEVVWASALGRAEQPLWLAVTVVGLAGSVGLLAVATRELPLGMAYAVWVGIGMLGTTAFSLVVRGERMSGPQLVCLGMVMVGILGMKLASHPEGSEVLAQDPATGA
ncbi:MAG TPA: multidrug efflux SMR transporter [Myxococcota bacterium]|nr:multidrug efflux SMR transporter [Myxococcota bacterium]